MPQWHPDTCECAFDVAQDWATAEPINVCQYHQGSNNAFAAVRAENVFKNIVTGVIQEACGVACGFRYDPDLVAIVPPESVQQAQTACDNEFGPGQVTCVGA